MTIPPEDFRLTSRARRDDGFPSSDVAAVDWVPIFLSALLPPRPALVGVTVVFDGAKYAGVLRLGPSSSSSWSSFLRIDNGTAAFDTWSQETSEAHTAIDTFHEIHDPESREWSDKPCTPHFGGALCSDRQG